MIEEIINIIKEYHAELDREYDNDIVLLSEVILQKLEEIGNNISLLKTAIPSDVPQDLVDKIKKI